MYYFYFSLLVAETYIIIHTSTFSCFILHTSSTSGSHSFPGWKPGLCGTECFGYGLSESKEFECGLILQKMIGYGYDRAKFLGVRATGSTTPY